MSKILSLTVAIALMCGLTNQNKQSTVSPIVDLKVFQPGCLFGVVRDREWIVSSDVLPAPPGEQKYRFYSLTGPAGEAMGSKPYNSGTPCEQTREVKFSPAPPSEATIAFGGRWDPMPRPVKVQSSAQPVYREAVAEFLRNKGIARPKINLTQVIRVDLEGDGTEEVILAATTFKEEQVSPDVVAGDYSVVLLRKVIAGKVETIAVYAEFYPQEKEFSAPNWCSVSAVLDLNGDGRMEIVVHGKYYEGAWTTIYAVNGNKVEEAMSCGCGA